MRVQPTRASACGTTATTSSSPVATGNVIPLPTRPVPQPEPVDLAALSELELQVVFYAAGTPWIVAPDGQSMDRLAPIVVDTINRIGLDLVREIAVVAGTAAQECDWATWNRVWPSM